MTPARDPTSTRNHELSVAVQWVATVGPGLVLLLILALWGLTAKEAWHDEALSVAATSDLLQTLQNTAGTMATYYILLTGWIQVSDSLWWTRLLSVLHAAGALVALGALAVRQRGNRVARWVCLVFGGSWMVVRYAQELRSFALVALVVAVAWWALDHLVGGGGRRWIAVHLLFCALAPATHGLAILAILAQVGAAVMAGVGWRVLLRASPGFVSSLAVVGVLYDMGGSDIGVERPLTIANARDLIERVHGGGQVWEAVDFVDVRWVLFSFTLLGIGVGLARAVRADRGVERFRALTPAVWAVGVIGGLCLLSMVHPSMIWRYAMPAVPALAMLQVDAAFAVQLGLQRATPRFGRWWRYTPVVPVLVLALVVTAQVPLHERFSNPWTQTTEYLRKRALDDDAVLVPRGSFRMPLDYAWSQHDGSLPELRSINPTTPLGDLQRYENKISVDRMVETIHDVERLWVLEIGGGGGRDVAFEDFMSHPDVVAGFTEAAEQRYRGVIIHLLERTG